MKILIVDDEPIVRKSLRMMLSEIDASYSIDDAHNGEIAKEKIKKNIPDLVLTDIVMPQCDGIELLKWIMTNYPEIRSIVLSSHEDFHYVKQSFVFGASNYLLKYEMTEDSVRDAIAVATVNMTVDKKSEMEKHCTFFGCSPKDFVLDKVSHELPESINDLRRNIIDKIFSSDIAGAYSDLNHLNAKVGSQFGTSVTVIKIMYTSIAERLASKYMTLFKAKKYVLDDINQIIISAERLEEIVNLLDSIFKSVFESSFNLVDLEKCSDIIKKIAEHINMNYSDSELGLDTLADRFRYSDAYISRKFKQETGVNLIDYINDVRVKAAEQMMKDSNLQVYKIAENVGYNNYNYFNKIFKRVTGVLPSEYLEKIDN